MAEHCSSIHGTEEDKVNCSFYWKVGACRHGDRCSRKHVKPAFSPTVIIPHMYAPPLLSGDVSVDEAKFFEEFCEEAIEELGKFGVIDEFYVTENLGDHMFGNVYVMYFTEEEAEQCLRGLMGRYYAGRVMVPEYSPVTEFRLARCRQFEESVCARGGYCNYLHARVIPGEVRRALRRAARKQRKPTQRRRSRSRPRSRGAKHTERGAKSEAKPKDRPISSVTNSPERRATISRWNRDLREQPQPQLPAVAKE